MIRAPEFTFYRRLALLSALAAVFLTVLLSNRPAYAGAPAGAGADLTATLLPTGDRVDESRLAVDWQGGSGARLTVRLGTSARASRVLVTDRVLSPGANLLTVPVARDAAGTLRMEVRSASGAVLRTVTQELAALRDESAFAWQPARRAALPGLMAGGSFNQAGGAAASNIARWDGTAWSPFTGPGGNGTDSTVSAITTFNGDLIVGGGFVYAGGTEVRGIARWDGSDWLPLTGSSGTGVMTFPFDFVSSLLVYNGSLVVGGQFPNAGGLPANHVARWDGTEWYPLTGASGTGVNMSSVWDLTIYDGALIVGGDFTEAGGVPASRVARWNGNTNTWSALAGGINPGELNGGVAALATYNGLLIAGGNFEFADGTQANNIAQWNGTSWSTLTGPSGTGVNDAVRALTVYQGSLVAGGQFTHAGGVQVNYIARWNGSTWSAFSTAPGTTLNTWVYSATVHEGVLVIGGGFTTALGSPTDYLARWTGTGWASLSGSDPNGPVMALFSL